MGCTARCGGTPSGTILCARLATPAGMDIGMVPRLLVALSDTPSEDAPQMLPRWLTLCLCLYFLCGALCAGYGLQ